MIGDGTSVAKATAKTTTKEAVDSPWPVDDITGLARRLPEVDPRRYFDGQAKEAYQQSLGKWPLLARLMNLVPRDEEDGDAP
ncbi:hypothetical protein [Paraburkholderia sp.]|uniref:hypothetical protein n=1 Tax=Paraburkholderia sp. TaxID=1926495 RepID=UPI002F3F7B6B